MEILATNSSSVGISLEASSNSIKCLLKVLTSGMAFTKEPEDLKEAIRTAELLGISIENWQIGKRKEKEKPITIDFCIKMPSSLTNTPQETTEDEKMKRVRKSKIKHVTRLDRSCFKCDICGHKSRNSAKMKRHVKIHSNNHKYECERCSYKFKNTHSLNSHISIAHSDNDNDLMEESKDDSKELCTKRRNGWSCDICGYCSARKRTILSHIETHSKAHSHSCQLCSYTFKNENSLLQHMTIFHSNACALDISRIKNENSETEDNSEMQNTSFFETANNNNPIILDEDRIIKESEAEEPENMCSLNVAGEYVCLKCGSVFKYRSGFIRHWNTHIGVKFRCDQCGSDFSRRDKLQNHIRNKHSGGHDKPIAGPSGESNSEKSNTDEEN